MSSPHIPRHGLHPIGFAPQELATLESFFKIAGQRPPGWWLTPDIRDAAVILLNAQSRDKVDDCQGMMSPWQKVVIVGASDFGSGWHFVPRPIKLMAILNKINQVLAEKAVMAPSTVAASLESSAAAEEDFQRTGPAPLYRATEPAASMPARQATPARPPQPEPMIQDLLSPARAPVFAPQAAPPMAPPSRPVPIDAAPSFAPAKPLTPLVRPSPPVAATAPPSAKAASRVLVVDDSDVALKFMQNRLRQFGYDGQLARSGEEALAMVAETPYKFVFLDVMMAGLDGYQTCRAIKQNKSHHGTAPRVIMLTSKGGTIDKIRGSMAGCDAYLTKPLNERQLAAVLVKYDSAASAERQSEAQDSGPVSRFKDSMYPRR